MAGSAIVTVTEIVEDKGRADPGAPALAFQRDIRAEEPSERLTYGELRRRARALACRLHEDGFRPGQRVMLLFPPGLDFVVAFFACAYAGLTAVPAPLPERTRAHVTRVEGILGDADPALVLTDDENLPLIGEWLAGGHGARVPCRSPAGLVPAAPYDWTPPLVGPGDVALLQYTSGSTSEPRGVVLTHGNLVADLRLIDEVAGHPRAVRLCGWLPMTHDMGLIGQLLYPLSTGGWCLLLPPAEFVRRPLRWLGLIGGHGAELVVAPNFAYDMCVRAARGRPDPEGIDLSRLRLVFNGAEPIKAATLDAFAETFAPARFRREAFVPCYGLAEATLLVSGKRYGGAPVVMEADGESLSLGELVPAGPGRPARALVSSGEVVGGNVLIVDPDTGAALPEGRVGEIWVSGPTVARGYRGPSARSAEVFGARAADGSGGHLRTGDLGVVRDGELYVTGRLKDVILLHGRNLYPQDLELAVQAQAGELRFGGGVVFALGGGEDIVVVQEVRGSRDDPELPSAVSRIKSALAAEFGVGRTSVVFVRPRTIRRTTSGKVRRSEMRRLFVDSALDPVHQSLAHGVGERLKERA